MAPPDSESLLASLPLLELPGVQDTYRRWQSSCAASFRITEVVWGAFGAVASARLARAQEAGVRALAASRAICAAGDPETRAEVGWSYFQESVDRAFAGAMASLELVAQPAREVVELLAPPAASHVPVELEATDRAA